MDELVSDLFISRDGYAAGEKTPGYLGMRGPELEAWVREQVDEPQEVGMGRRTYELLAEFANSPVIGVAVLRYGLRVEAIAPASVDEQVGRDLTRGPHTRAQ